MKLEKQKGSKKRMVVEENNLYPNLDKLSNPMKG
jgi:hypothetical protein